MAQELEQIVEILREMKRATSNNSESFDRLLNSINNKLNMMDKNDSSADLIKTYLGEIAKSTEDRYSKTMSKFSEIEQALKSIFNSQDEHVKTKDIKELFDIFSTNLNNFYSEARQQRALITSIEARISELSNNKSDKEDILRTITLLRNDFENLNQVYKNTIDSVNTDIRTIISNLTKSDQTAINNHIKEQVDIMYRAINDIINCLTAIDKRDANLEQLLSNVATNENLKHTQAVVDSIIKKSEEISQQITTLANKSDIEGLQMAASYMNQKIDETATKSSFEELSDKTDSLNFITSEIKQSLAKVSKDIEAIPDTSDLEESVQDLFKKLDSISKDIERASVKKNFNDLNLNFSNFTEDFQTIKNIIEDLNEVVTLKILTAINDLSFENEFNEIKDHVTKVLATLPQKEDIDIILESNETNKETLEDLINKTEILTDKVEALPTHDDIETLNNTQISLIENLQGIANKDDIERLASKADEIEDMIDKINFDDEFENLYDKTASIEKWLIASNVKETSAELMSKIDKKAEQKDVLSILKTMDNIVDEIDELSRNIDVKKVNRTVADVYQMIEELKNDFINTTEMHNDSVIVNLSELQKSIENIVTGDEFDNFVEDLKSFVANSISNNEEFKTQFIELKEYQLNILERLEKLNISSIEESINKSSLSIEESLNSISDYLSNINKTNTEEIKKAIAEIKEILENKKSNFHEIEKGNSYTIASIEDYLKEIKMILDTSDQDLSENVKIKLEEIENNLKNYQTSNENAISAIISKLEEYQNKIDMDENSPDGISTSRGEITEIKDRIIALSNAFNSTNFENSNFAGTSTFVSQILTELGSNLDILSNNIDDKLQHGFAYNAELIEEKTSAIIDFIRELKESNTTEEQVYNTLDSADIQLEDCKQEIEFINTDIINSINSKNEQLLEILIPIKEMLANLVLPENNEKATLKENLTDIHDSVIDDIVECTKYSKSTFDKLEDSYEKISRELTDTQNNIKDFILSDIDSVIVKIDNLKADLEYSIEKITPPDASQMEEFRTFVEQIREFSCNPVDIIEKTAEGVKKSITETLTLHQEQIKSLLTVSVNNEEIINAIEDLKSSFYKKLEELNKLRIHSNQNTETIEEFATNQYEEVFESNQNTELVRELQNDFEKFSKLVKDLTTNNPEIEEVLDIIKSKMETISIAKTSSKQTIHESIKASDSDFDSDYDDSSDSDDDMEVSLVGVGNFDFIKAFDLLKHDIQNLHDDVEKILSREEQYQATAIAESDTTNTTNIDNETISALNTKFEELTNIINKREWLEEIKAFIAGDEIHTILEEISSKIDVLTLSDNSEIINEVKNVISQLEIGTTSIASDPQIQSMLNLINEKIDIIASNEDYQIMEDVRDAIERIDSNSSNNNEETEKMLNAISSKIDDIASNGDTQLIEEVKEAIERIDLNTACNNEETEKLLNTISSKIDVIASNGDTQLIEEVKEAIERIDLNTACNNEETEKLLNTISSKIDVIASSDNISDFEDIKDSFDLLTEQLEEINKNIEESNENVIKSIFDELNTKIDEIRNDNKFDPHDFEDIKNLINEQSKYIENLDNSSKFDAIKDCLDNLTENIEDISFTDNTEIIKQLLREMKESIMAATVTLFDQISFIEEAEEIKDFIVDEVDEVKNLVDEKAGEINKNLANVTNQLKQITSSEEDPDYVYSMQDIESDLAKLRLALSNIQTPDNENQTQQLTSILENINSINNSVEELQNSLPKDEELENKFEKVTSDINTLSILTKHLVVSSDESYSTLTTTFEEFNKLVTEKLTTKFDKVTKLLENSNDSDKVMRQALIYMGEWIDSASESMNKISTNAEEIIEVKSALESLKKTIPAQTDILNSIEEKFDEQQERLAYFEKQITKLSGIEDQFEAQQARIDRLEMALEKILSAVEDIDDSKVTRKIDKLDKQLAKLSTNIEKIASYVD